MPPMNPPSPEYGRPALLYAARVTTSERMAALFDDDGIASADDQYAAWFDADRDAAVIEYFCATRAEAEQRLTMLQTFIRAHDTDAPCEGDVRELPAENWADSWKRFFHTEKVSDRIWIKPSWEPCAPAPGEVVVELDPGMSFGTGQHGTTRGCLQLLDTLARGPAPLSLVDIGCGSGILAIAAARLGYRDILALDNDPVAVRIATGNARHNGVADGIAFQVAALGTIPLPRRFDVVVANILAEVLIAHAGVLAQAVSPVAPARLVLSGILASQADDVIAAFAPLAFRPVAHLPREEWITLCLAREPLP